MCFTESFRLEKGGIYLFLVKKLLFLGVILDSTLPWGLHVKHIQIKFNFFSHYSHPFYPDLYLHVEEYYCQSSFTKYSIVYRSCLAFPRKHS